MIFSRLSAAVRNLGWDICRVFSFSASSGIPERSCFCI